MSARQVRRNTASVIPRSIAQCPRSIHRQARQDIHVSPMRGELFQNWRKIEILACLVWPKISHVHPIRDVKIN
jgi:hypothetical protein